MFSSNPSPKLFMLGGTSFTPRRAETREDKVQSTPIIDTSCVANQDINYYITSITIPPTKNNDFIYKTSRWLLFWRRFCIILLFHYLTIVLLSSDMAFASSKYDCAFSVLPMSMYRLPTMVSILATKGCRSPKKLRVK
jgi:hypothetical protein